MRYRRLDETGDMLPARGNPPFEGAEAVGAAVRSRILMFLGEWWESPDDRLDISYFLGYQSTEKRIVADALLRQRIMETEGVTNIVSLVFGDPSAGRRSVSVVLDTDTGGSAAVSVTV